MIEKRTIENVNPLIGFRLDCYRHALLPAIKHFSGDIRPFLLAKSGEFLFSEHLEFKETSLINYNKVLSFIGIDRQTIKINDDIIEIICDNISRDKIVLAFIDTYKYSRFPSSYLKFHSRHDLPIFGFDKNNKVFDIIDSDYIEGFSRRKATISFDEFIIARIELLEHYKMTDSIEIISPKEKKDFDFFYKYVNLYHDIYINNKTAFQESINSLERFVEYFNNNFKNQELIMKSVSSLYLSFNRAINLRHLEYAAFKEIFCGIEDTLQCLDKLIELYNYVRAVMYKTSYTKQYREISFEKCGEMMYDIVSLEKDYYELLCKDIICENIKEGYCAN